MKDLIRQTNFQNKIAKRTKNCATAPKKEQKAQTLTHRIDNTQSKIYNRKKHRNRCGYDTPILKPFLLFRNNVKNFPLLPNAFVFSIISILP